MVNRVQMSPVKASISKKTVQVIWITLAEAFSLLKDLNEMAILALKNDDNDAALESLKKCEQLLEVRT
jgi:hypothetical protein